MFRVIWGEVVSLAFFLSCIMLCCQSKGFNLSFKRTNVQILLLLIALFIINYFVHAQDGASISAYIAFMVSLCGTFLVAECITMKVFLDAFVRIMVWIAPFSLIMHFLAYVLPLEKFAYSSPNSNTAKIVLLHNYYAFDQNRNSGMFSEPGLYAVLLVIALVFLLIRERVSGKRKIIWATILIVTTLTTLSTTAYLVLMIVVGLYVYISISKQKNQQNKVLVAFLILPVAVLILVLLFQSDVFYRKLILGEASFSVRQRDLLNSFELMKGHLLLGYGYQSFVLANKYLSYGDHAVNSVGLLSTILNMGWLYGGLYMVRGIKCTIAQYQGFKALIILAVLFVFSLSQAVLEYPLYFIFLFLFNKEKKIKCFCGEERLCADV